MTLWLGSPHFQGLGSNKVWEGSSRGWRRGVSSQNCINQKVGKHYAEETLQSQLISGEFYY